MRLGASGQIPPGKCRQGSGGVGGGRRLTGGRREGGITMGRSVQSWWGHVARRSERPPAAAADWRGPRWWRTVPGTLQHGSPTPERSGVARRSLLGAEMASMRPHFAAETGVPRGRLAYDGAMCPPDAGVGTARHVQRARPASALCRRRKWGRPGTRDAAPPAPSAAAARRTPRGRWRTRGT